ncbi:MAG: DUF2934 domain-containing protein [Pseudomonadota bacterium]
MGMITRERIAARAYEIYLERGSGPGRDREDWLQAEREVTAAAEDDEPNTVEARPARVIRSRAGGNAPYAAAPLNGVVQPAGRQRRARGY